MNQMPVVSAIRHVGIVVRDLEKSLAFYSGVLGLKIYRRFVEQGSFIDQLTGIEGVTLEWVKLIIPQGGLIELLQYHSHPDSEAQVPARPSPSNALGCSHVALTVNDLDQMYSRLRAYGCTAKSMPIMTPNNSAKIVYCHDPEGNILELIEDVAATVPTPTTTSPRQVRDR